MIRQAILKLAVRAVDKASRGIAGAGMGLRLLSDDLNDWAESMKPEPRVVVGIDLGSKDATGMVVCDAAGRIRLAQIRGEVVWTPDGRLATVRTATEPEPWWKTGTEAEKWAKRMELRAQLGREGPPEDWRPSSHGHPDEGWDDRWLGHVEDHYRGGVLRGWIRRCDNGRWEGARLPLLKMGPALLTERPPVPAFREFSMKVAARRWVENQGGEWRSRPGCEDYYVGGQCLARVVYDYGMLAWRATRTVPPGDQHRDFPVARTPAEYGDSEQKMRSAAKRWAEGCE